MSRYIDADAFEEVLKKLNKRGIYPTTRDERITKNYLDEFPTADVVEVVRCKDCTRQMICFHSDDYFCADGERRKE